MTIPNLGVTQLIQQQGPLGIASQGLGQLGQLMMQIEQAKQEKAKNDANVSYLNELTTTQRTGREAAAAEAERLAAERATMGGALRDYLTPQQVDINIPSVPGGFGTSTLPVQATGTRERTLQDILPQLPPELVAQFTQQVAPVEQTRQQKIEAGKMKATLNTFLRTLPPQMREPMRAIVELESAGVPSNLSQQIVSGLIKEAGKDPKAIAALRKKYPELAALPDEQVLEMGAGLMYDQLRMRLGLIRNPNLPPPGSGGPSTGGLTPADKQFQDLLEKQVERAGKQAAAFNDRPKELQSPVPGQPFIPRNQYQKDALNAFVTDSTEAANAFNAATGAYDTFTTQALMRSLGIQPPAEGAAGMNPEVEQATQAAEAHAAIKNNPNLSPAEKMARHQQVDAALAQTIAAMRGQP